MTVGVIVPTYNRRDLLRACLESILAHTQATQPTFQILVVDDGSNDGTFELVEHLGLDCLRSEVNQGFAVACNAGFGALYTQASSLDAVVFLNNDTYIRDPLWLDKLTRPLHDNAIVGCRLVYQDGTTQHTGVSLAFDGVGVLHGHNQKAERHTGPVEAVTGACMAVDPKIFAELGGFYEGYRNGNEDVDLCLKARAEGHTVWYVNELTVTHHESQSGPERWAHVGENVRLLTHRWPTLPPPPLKSTVPHVDELAPIVRSMEG
jgi:GT2 family glycosyltransferase